MNLEARREAVGSLSSLLRRDDLFLSEHHANKLAERLVGHALLVRGYLAPVEEGERTVLKQQRTHQYESIDWWAEEVHHRKREYEDAAAIYERVKAQHIADYDADLRGEREDDRRLSQAAADEKALTDAPAVAS